MVNGKWSMVNGKWSMVNISLMIILSPPIDASSYSYLSFACKDNPVSKV